MTPEGERDVTLLSCPEVPEIDPRLRDVFDALMEEFGPSS